MASSSPSTEMPDISSAIEALKILAKGSDHADLSHSTYEMMLENLFGIELFLHSKIFSSFEQSLFISNLKMASTRSTTLKSNISSALEDLTLLTFRYGVCDSNYQMMLLRFYNLELFLHSTKFLGNDSSLRFFLKRIEIIVQKWAESIHYYRLFMFGEATLDDIWGRDLKHYADKWFLGNFKSWEKGMDHFYRSLLDTWSEIKTEFYLPLEVMDLWGSVKEKVMFLRSLILDAYGEYLAEPINDLGVQIHFLIILELFVGMPSTNFSAHIGTICIKVSYLFFKCDTAGKENASSCDEIRCLISEVIQDIKPTSPRVRKIYIDYLNCSWLARRSTGSHNQFKDYNMIARDFIGSLMSNLWEILQLDIARGVVFAKDQLQELYEGLGSLRIILSQQPTVSCLINEDFMYDLVSGAGGIVCSLYATRIQLLERMLRNMLEAIRLIFAKLRKKDATEPIPHVLITAPQSFVDSLLEKLGKLTICETGTNTHTYAQMIEKELVSLRSFLTNILELLQEQEKIRILWDHIFPLLYRVKHLIDNLIDGDLSSSFSTSFESTMKDIEKVKLEIKDRKDNKMKGVSMTPLHVPPHRTLSLENEVVGFVEEAESIKNSLTRGSKKLEIVAVVGMPGQGKTTLAAKIYNDSSISCHFSVRVQTYVSQPVDKNRVLLNILDQTNPNKCSKIAPDDQNILVQTVWRSLKGKRYLIFLDDIWDAEAWNNLKEAFPDDQKSSRILLTSRNDEVAPKPHKLRPLKEEESLALLQSRLFNGSDWPSNLVDIGMQIAKFCQGLPLTLVIIAGILATENSDRWRKILDDLTTSLGVSILEQCKITLQLNYDHLPEYLRPCFLYSATFSKEHVSVQRLLRMWIGEGFVKKEEKKEIEDVAEGYLQALISRSLLTVAQEASLGGVKVCRIHGLLHEFCLQKAKEERFFFVVGSDDYVLEFQSPDNLRRLGICSDPKYLTRLIKFFPFVRSLYFNDYPDSLNSGLFSFTLYARQPLDLSFMIRMCKLLRVLDLEWINLGNVFPSEIGLLAQLAFLAVRGGMRDIPPSIGNLSNLETFILNQISFTSTLSLPKTFWNLRKLRYLYLSSPGGIFPMKNFTKSNLCELDRISGIAIRYGDNMASLMKMFPIVRKLKCILLDFDLHDAIGTHVKIVVPDFLSQLESLSLSLPLKYKPNVDIMFDFGFPANLKKLSLPSLNLSRGSLASISKLPNLQVLKLVNVRFEADTWILEEEEEKFSNLRFLYLWSSTLISWSASEDQFESLKKLVLSNCESLKEMPSCLERIMTLEEIRVIDGSSSVLESVRKIKEVQEEEYGNLELKIITS